MSLVSSDEEKHILGTLELSSWVTCASPACPPLVDTLPNAARNGASLLEEEIWALQYAGRGSQIPRETDWAEHDTQCIPVLSRERSGDQSHPHLHSEIETGYILPSQRERGGGHILVHILLLIEEKKSSFYSNLQ